MSTGQVYGRHDRGLKAKLVILLLNQEADRTLSFSPLMTNLWSRALSCQISCHLYDLSIWWESKMIETLYPSCYFPLVQ